MEFVRKEIRTALLAIVTLAIVTGVLLLIGAPGVFKRMKTFHIYFDNAASIKQGAPVLLAGRRIGQVTRLRSPVPPNERPEPPKGEKPYEAEIEVQVEHNALIYKKIN